MIINEMNWFDLSNKKDLESGEVHAWFASLDYQQEDEAFGDTLSPGEQERASRLISDRIRGRFVRAHAITRRILSVYANQPAGSLQFRTGEQGKPQLMGLNQLDLQFNLSHSDNILMVAVARAMQIGVDVEIHDPEINSSQIAQTYFTQNELAWIARSNSMEEKIQSFYRIWTAKEAFLKAKGIGLLIDLQKVGLIFDPEDELAFETLPGGESEIRRWKIHGLSFNGGSGAVVIEKLCDPIKFQFYLVGKQPVLVNFHSNS